MAVVNCQGLRECLPPSSIHQLPSSLMPPPTAKCVWTFSAARTDDKKKKCGLFFQPPRILAPRVLCWGDTQDDGRVGVYLTTAASKFDAQDETFAAQVVSVPDEFATSFKNERKSPLKHLKKNVAPSNTEN